MVILSSLPPPTDGIRHTESNTAAFINQQNFGTGTLYIAESRLSWVSNAGQGFSMEYPAIALHAISKDTNAFPYDCLYLMIDSVLTDPSQDAAANVAKASASTDCIEMAEKLKGVSVSNQCIDTDTVIFVKNTSAQSGKIIEKNDGKDFLSPSCGAASSTSDAHHNGHGVNAEHIENGEVNEEDEAEEPDEAQITEIRFVPANPSSLEAIFQAMAECQAMHPDENESFSDDESASTPMEGGIGGFYAAEDFDAGDEGGDEEAMDQDAEMMDDEDPALYEDAPDDTS